MPRWDPALLEVPTALPGASGLLWGGGRVSGECRQAGPVASRWDWPCKPGNPGERLGRFRMRKPSPRWAWP